MHPAHVPLHGEAQAVQIDGPRNAGERGGFLGDGEGAGHAVRQLVEAPQKIDGFQILVAAVLIGNPLAGLARVIEVQHRSHGVHAQAVDVIFLQPEQRVRNQERAHFVAAVIEDQGAPVAVLALARIGMLVERGAVEISQAVRVLGKMRGHPIHDHADARLVAADRRDTEIVAECRSAKWGHSSRSPDSPRNRKKDAPDGQKLDVRVAQSLHVFHQLCRELAIGKKVLSGPRSQDPRCTS